MKKLKLKKAQAGLIAPGRENITDLSTPAPVTMDKKEKFWDSPLTLNWSHILASQVVQGIGVAAGNNNANSYENAVLNYNKTINPTSWLPQNPNTSQQALYGMQAGGEIIDAYIKDFIYGEAQPDPTEAAAPTPKKKVIGDKVSEQDVDQVMQEVEDNPYMPRQKSSQRMASLLSNPNVDLNDIDPNVQSATSELLDKFPGLKITSGRRSWGDKDAHPKGRAVDVAGDPKMMEEAWKYYKENIVPKYNFNAALPLNHGTGPHIHLGYYQQGGKATTVDSLNLYNNSKAVQAYYDSYKYKKSSTLLQPQAFPGNSLYSSIDVDVDYFNKRNNDGGIKVPTKDGSDFRKIPSSLYHKDIDANRFLQRESASSILDTRAPMQLFDRRIKPTTRITADNTDDTDSLYGDSVDMFSYDPIAVKPWNMLSNEEKKLRIQRYGAPQEQQQPSTSNSKQLVQQMTQAKPATKYYTVNGQKVTEDQLNDVKQLFSHIGTITDPKEIAKQDAILNKYGFKPTLSKNAYGLEDDKTWKLDDIEAAIKAAKPYTQAPEPQRPKPVNHINPQGTNAIQFTPPTAQPRTNILDRPQQPTNYSYSYRDEQGQQQSKYFNDWDTWKMFVDQQPYIDAPSNAAKTYGHATGHYLKKQDGGAIPNPANPLFDPEDNAQEALKHAAKLKTHKNGNFKALIPMEQWSDDLMNYIDKLKFVERKGEKYAKVRGSFKERTPATVLPSEPPQEEYMQLGGGIGILNAAKYATVKQGAERQKAAEAEHQRIMDALPKVDKDKNIHGPVGYLDSYYNSDEFKRRYAINNSDYDDFMKRYAEQSARYKPKVVEDNGGRGSYQDPIYVKGSPTMVLDKKQAKDNNVSLLADVLPHEWAHQVHADLSDADNRAFAESNNNPRVARVYDNYRKTKGSVPKNFSTWLQMYNNDNHDEAPNENYADLDYLRWLMYDLKIYDVRKGDMQQEHLDKLRQTPGYKDNFMLKRLSKSFDDKKLIELNNSVGSTGSKDEVPVAKQGGEMHLGGGVHGQMTKSMAKKILKDGDVNGHDLTDKQKHYFQHIATGQVTFKGGHPYYKGKKYDDGGLINTTGYTEGSATENNPVNVIPSGGITMANVYSPVIAVPVKGNKVQDPVVMEPNKDYAFDADHTIEFKAGGSYDLSKEHIEMLRKLGYDVEIM